MQARTKVLLPNDGNCVFCGKPYGRPHWAGGNNPEPIFAYDEARACDECNGAIVIPVRLGNTVFTQDGSYGPNLDPS